MNSISWPDPSDPGRISLAYRDLSQLPEGWQKELSFADITALDLSHNNLSYPCVVSACSDMILKTKLLSVKSKISAQPNYLLCIHVSTLFI